MAIHHSQIKKAEKAGFTLEEQGDLVRAFWPKRSLAIYGTSASDAMAQMQAAMVVMSGDEYSMVAGGDQPRLVHVYREDGMRLVGSPMPPVSAHGHIVLNKTAQWEDPEAEKPNLDETIEEQQPILNAKPVERSDSGIALDGAVAFKEGTPAGDCPYSSETDDDEEYANFERWNEEWDNAADEQTEEEGGGKGTVVAEKYRARYAEAGHPTHCGDWLAEFLNNQVLSKAGTDLDRFEAICALNGVDTSKYRRTGIGWQGRLRMTGRNLLAKKVYLAGGILLVPGDDPAAGPNSYKAPGEWMQSQRFKMPKADQAKPIPEATIAVTSPKVDGQGAPVGQPYDTPDAAE